MADGFKREVSGTDAVRLFAEMPHGVGGAVAPSLGWRLHAAPASCAVKFIAMRAARLDIALMALDVASESDPARTAWTR